MRLHLLAEEGDSGHGPGTSLGYVEQIVKRKPWDVSRRSDAELIARSNVTFVVTAVPDIETGMAIVLMNAKGNDGNT